jgi:hypothetical protein
MLKEIGVVAGVLDAVVRRTRRSSGMKHARASLRTSAGRQRYAVEARGETPPHWGASARRRRDG